ncbi:GPI transamidase subunit PIG-U [Flammula alnicola]|nr:GPI transamidase subunit PIG-U [Flammula alnicola]
MSSTSTGSSPPKYSSIPSAYLILIAARLWLSLTDLSSTLKHNQQLSSPLTSFSQLQEGIYLFNYDIDPYSGGSFRHSPLLLSFFATILPNSKKLASVLWTLNDAVGAWAMVQIFRSRQNVKRSPRDNLVAALYLLNPYIFLPSLALSTSSFENTLMLLSIMFACQGKSSASPFALSFLVHLSLSPIVVLLPLLLLLINDPFSHLASPKAMAANVKSIIPLFAEFAIYFGALTLVSTLVCGSWAWIPQTWGATLTLPDLTPTTGLWWYFFTEMFDHFRPFFLMVFSVHMLIYVVPVCLKFQYDPLYAVFILLGILGMFKPYTTLSDPGLFLSMTAIFPEIFPYLRHPIVTALLHLHASLLMPLFHHLWLTQGTGNANFFYASTLVFACANGAAVVDCIWAGLRIAIGPDVDGYTIAQE